MIASYPDKYFISISYGYSIELPHYCNSNENPQHILCFLSGGGWGRRRVRVGEKHGLIESYGYFVRPCEIRMYHIFALSILTP